MKYTLSIITFVIVALLNSCETYSTGPLLDEDEYTLMWVSFNIHDEHKYMFDEMSIYYLSDPITNSYNEYCFISNEQFDSSSNVFDSFILVNVDQYIMINTYHIDQDTNVINDTIRFTRHDLINDTLYVDLTNE